MGRKRSLDRLSVTGDVSVLLISPVADPDFELRWGPGFGLLALPAFLSSVISSFFHSK